MEKIIINGAVKLAEEVSIGGSKNSLSAILPAACLKDKDTVFTVRNVPGISDVKCLCDLLASTTGCFLPFAFNRICIAK